MDFIFVSTADWDHPFWTNKQHVANTLAEMGHRILYIDSLGLRQPTATASDVGRIYRRLKKLFAGIRAVKPGIWVLSPFSIPLQKYGLVRKLNSLILIWMINHYQRKLGFSNPVFWTYNPMTSYLLEHFNTSQAVYHCVDEISAQPGMPRDIMQAEERKLLSKVDVVFTTAVTLNEEKKAYNPHCYYFSNVADYSHFHKAVTECFERPKDLPKENTGRKILGFIGAISGYKLDFKLVALLAAKHPAYDIILIGKIGEGDANTDVGILRKYANIHFLGAKKYHELPAYIAYFDVALLPCVVNEYTQHMFPMKFFEYLAAGRQVVARRIKPLEPYSDICFLADNEDEFVSKVDDVINNRRMILQDKLDEVAKEHTYVTRTKKMLECMKHAAQ